MSWINLSAIWKIAVFGLLAGAGLPALFAIGLRALATPGIRVQTAGTDSDHVYGGNVLGLAIAAVLENESHPESAEAIRRAIAAVTDHHQPSDADVARVRARLAAGGWPLAKPGQFDPANWP